MTFCPRRDAQRIGCKGGRHPKSRAGKRAPAPRVPGYRWQSSRLDGAAALFEKNTDSILSSWMNHVFAVLMVQLDYIPESFHLSGFIISGHVVKRYQSARPDKRRIHLPVPLHPFIGVVAIDKQEVNGSSAEQRLEVFERRVIM